MVFRGGERLYEPPLFHSATVFLSSHLTRDAKVVLVCHKISLLKYCIEFILSSGFIDPENLGQFTWVEYIKVIKTLVAPGTPQAWR